MSAPAGAIGAVVLVSDFAHITGGASKVAIASAIRLAERGHRVVMLSAIGPVDQAMVDAGVEVVCLGVRDLILEAKRLRAAVRGLWYRRAASALGRILDDCPEGRTLVHFHQWTKALTASVFTAAQRRKVPFVVTFHDYFVVCPNGGFLVYPSATLCERRPLSPSCLLCRCDKRSYAHKQWRVARQAVQSVFAGVPRRLQHCIYVSETSRRVLQPHLQATLEWHHVPNPISVERRPRAKVSANRGYIFIGRLDPEKGAAVFARAAKIAGVQSVFVGDGSQKEEILEIDAGAVVTGWLDHAGVVARLCKARALVFPSLWYETLGLVVLEAMAHGIPVIVSRQSAARDLFVEGESGFAMRTGDAEDLAEKIKALEDDDTAQRLSKNAYESFWSAPPLIDTHVDHLLKVYGRMLKAG